MGEDTEHHVGHGWLLAGRVEAMVERTGYAACAGGELRCGARTSTVSGASWSIQEKGIHRRESRTMSTFYLLPPRPLLGRQFAQILQEYFPGLDCSAAPSAELAELLATMVGSPPQVVVVFREDVPDGVDLQEALVGHFGAEAGDEVVEVSSGSVRRWQVKPCGAGFHPVR
jgi:hypothetical protein